MTSSGIVCVCGAPLELSSRVCLMCGNVREIKFDKRLSDEGWVAYRKYLISEGRESEVDFDEKFRSDKKLFNENQAGGSGFRKATPESMQEVLAESESRRRDEIARMSAPRPRNVVYQSYEGVAHQKKRKIDFGIVYVSVLAIVVLGVIGFGISSHRDVFRGSSLTGSKTSNFVSLSDSSTQAIGPGDSWDIYISYYVECALTSYDYFEKTATQSLSCSGDGSNISDYRAATRGESVKQEWWLSENTRRNVCASQTVFRSNFMSDGDLGSLDSETSVNVENRGSLLVSGQMVQPPVLELETLSNVPDERYLGTVITPTDSGSEITSEIRAEELASFASGFCVVKFHVNKLPEFSGALEIYIDSGEDESSRAEWSLNEDELLNRNSLIYEDSYMRDFGFNLWKANRFGSRLDKFAN